MKSGKLYSKEISPKCLYCSRGRQVNGGKEILCLKMGVMQPDSCCKKFKYDPLKRAPETLKLKTDFSPEDFKL